VTTRRILWSQTITPGGAGLTFDIGQEDGAKPLPPGAAAIVGVATNAAISEIRMEEHGQGPTYFQRLALAAGQGIEGLYIPLPRDRRGVMVPRFVGSAPAVFVLTLTLEIADSQES
jgi:hypothetical protein